MGMLIIERALKIEGFHGSHAIGQKQCIISKIAHFISNAWKHEFFYTKLIITLTEELKTVNC